MERFQSMMRPASRVKAVYLHPKPGIDLWGNQPHKVLAPRFVT